MAPWEVKEATTPSNVEPRGCAATNVMKASGSFTAGGGSTRRRRLPLPAFSPSGSSLPGGVGGASTSSVAWSIAARKPTGRLARRAVVNLLAVLPPAFSAFADLFSLPSLDLSLPSTFLARALGPAALARFAPSALSDALSLFTPCALTPWVFPPWVFATFFSGDAFGVAAALAAFFLAALASGTFAAAFTRPFAGALVARFNALATSAAFRGADSWSSASPSASASRVALRLRGPRTGRRGVKIHPTPGTGLPPTRRPSSKRHGCSSWYSWNQTIHSPTAPVRSTVSRRPQ